MTCNWNLFDNLDEVVYISDIDTNELVYINEKGLEEYGLERENALGKPCYEVLQNNEKPCTMCTNDSLYPGKYIKWSYYNPVIGKHMLLHDTMFVENGRRYRMEMAIDTTAQESRNQMNILQLNMERLVNDAIAIAIQKPTPDQTLDSLLESIGKILGSDRVYIFEKNACGNMDNTYEWVTAGVSHEKEQLQNVPSETFLLWDKGFKKENMVVIEDVNKIQESDPLVYKYLKPQNIHSLVVVPFSLHIKMETLEQKLDIDGFYGVDNPPKELIEQAKTLLRIMASFILGALKRRNLVRELEEMSMTDTQTKLRNRYAMNQHIPKIKGCKKLGIIYCDINGLKQANDTFGHQEGDQLILRACECMREVLKDCHLYRIGGDEFLAICPDTEKSIVKEKIESLKNLSFERNAVLSVGMSWTQDGTEDIDGLMSEAEQQMYEDKARYYELCGLERRKSNISAVSLL